MICCERKIPHAEDTSVIMKRLIAHLKGSVLGDAMATEKSCREFKH